MAGATLVRVQEKGQVTLPARIRNGEFSADLLRQ